MDERQRRKTEEPKEQENPDDIKDIGTPSKSRKLIPEPITIAKAAFKSPFIRNSPAINLPEIKDTGTAKLPVVTTQEPTEPQIAKLEKNITFLDNSSKEGSLEAVTHTLQPVRRQRSLIRPERSRHPSAFSSKEKETKRGGWWYNCSHCLTFCYCSCCLKNCGMKDLQIQQAWREKVALCTIIFLMCVFLAYITFFMQNQLCSNSYDQSKIQYPAVAGAGFIAQGRLVNSKNVTDGSIRTQLYPYALPSGCNKLCTTDCIGISDPSSLGNEIVYFEWTDIQDPSKKLVVFNGQVLDASYVLSSPSIPAAMKAALQNNLGGDATHALAGSDPSSLDCLLKLSMAGNLEIDTIGCISGQVFLYCSLIVILSVVLLRFFLAIYFSWFVAPRLGRASPTARPTDNNSQNRQQQLARLSMYSTSLANTTGTFNSRSSSIASRYSSALNRRMFRSSSFGGLFGMRGPKEDSTNSDKMYTILLVTCYSEGEEGIRDTLTSLTETEYDDRQKLIVIIADGMIKGAGNNKTTPEICVDLITLDPSFPEPEAKSYVAIADGSKRHNMAKVYCGHFSSNGHTAAVLVIAKVGTPQEASGAKPGNRGKRDSQIILMNFFCKTLFDDRMCPLEYELFHKMFHLTGILPDQYEIVLMVDADTKVMPKSLTYLLNAMKNDTEIMGLCGETKIENKAQSWVTAIQVFEYYASHHLAKSFESIFGGVTCLPGCFCMYRIKAPKGQTGFWVPILSNPEIINHYSENVTDTLHKKNLLLLGEDRFLTTLMLKTFPKRKMIFVPNAVCRTTVPDTFRVLLSQRRRWINSTIHNLLELVLVRDLCGTFCCSMQFVIFMELVGSVVLPAAITFTIVMIVVSIVGTPQWIPLGLLAAILGLPAFLILFTAKSLTYVMWMLIYLLSLPVWNFILPAYAFWHFDDFSWGQTRKVEGQDGGHGHGDKEGEFDAQIPMKRWHEWVAENK